MQLLKVCVFSEKGLFFERLFFVIQMSCRDGFFRLVLSSYLICFLRKYSTRSYLVQHGSQFGCQIFQLSSWSETVSTFKVMLENAGWVSRKCYETPQKQTVHQQMGRSELSSHVQNFPVVGCFVGGWSSSNFEVFVLPVILKPVILKVLHNVRMMWRCDVASGNHPQKTPPDSIV